MSIIGLKKANCKNCYKCVKVCPVKSIKVEDAQAQIIVKDFVRNGEQVIVSLAPSYVGSFAFETCGQLIAAIQKLGIWGVSETAQGAALVSAEYFRLAKEGAMDNIITTCCPAVNDLVEKHFPAATRYLAPVVSPMIAHGKALKQTYGAGVKVVFVGPCFAKKGEATDIRHDTCIDAVLTYDDLSGWMEDAGVDIAACSGGKFLNGDTKVTRLYPVAAGILKTITAQGEVPQYDYICVDGVENCMDLLKAVIAGSVHHCLIEMSACAGSCINGPAKTKHEKNRFSTKLELEGSVRQEGMDFPEIAERVPMGKQFVDRSNRDALPDEAAIRAILQKVGKETPEQELNCGLCGYESCRAKAIAVYQGKAELTMCIPFMRERAESMSNLILAQTPNITVMVDSDLNIVEFNAAAEAAFGLTRAEALKKSLFELIDTTDFQYVLETKQSIYDKKVVYEDYHLVTVQNLIYIAEENLVMGIFNDITKEESEKENRYKLRVETLEMAQKVIDKQMTVAQQIAGLLGETTADTKVTLTKLKDMIVFDGEEV